MSELAVTTPKINPQLKKTLQVSHTEEFSLLMQVDKVNAASEIALIELGIIIRHRLKLVSTYAVTCTGAVALQAATLPFVCRVEEDRPVYTQSSSSINHHTQLW